MKQEREYPAHTRSCWWKLACSLAHQPSAWVTTLTVPLDNLAISHCHLSPADHTPFSPITPRNPTHLSAMLWANDRCWFLAYFALVLDFAPPP